jgi:hypothetical protein
MDRHGALSRQEFTNKDTYLSPGSFAQDFSAQATDMGENDFGDYRQQDIAYQGYPEVGFPWNYPGRIL